MKKITPGRASDKAPIYTIGYGGRPIDEFLKLIGQFGVEYVLDVRSSPHTRQPDYQQETLKDHLSSLKVQYAYFGNDLGGRPEDPSCYQDGYVDYDACRATESFRRGVGRLHTAWEKGICVALMCSEKRPEECHRSKMIGVGLDEAGIDVAHIDEEGILRTQEEVIQRISKDQGDLFGKAADAGLTSRYQYH